MHGKTDGTLTGREIEMKRIEIPDYLIYLRGLAAVAVLLLGNSALHAADDCLSKPKPGEIQGRVWHYRINPATHRRCWYAARPATERARADATGAQAAPSAAAAPPSAVQQLVNVLTGNSQNNDPKPPSSKVEPPRVRGPNAAATEPSRHHAPRQVSRATEHSRTLDETQRDTLFRNFLQWEAQKKDRVSQ